MTAEGRGGGEDGPSGRETLEGGRALRGLPRFPEGAGPTISIITASHRACAELRGCLASVAERGGPRTEHLVIDGGSSDGTVELLREQDERLGYWRSAKDRGPYDAMNAGVAQAAGEYVLFLGADDRLLDLAPLSAAVRPREVVYGDVRRKSDGSRYGRRLTGYGLAVRNVCQQAVLYPRALLLAHPFDVRYRILADHALHLQLWGAGVPFRYVPAEVALFDDTGGLSSTQRDPAFEADHLSLVRRHLPLPAALAFALRHAALRGLEALGLRRRLGEATRRLRGRM